MAAAVLWIASLTMVTSILNGHDCEAVSAYSKNREHHPQKMVEIIELMLSPRPDNSARRNLDIQKVPQDEPPAYEILVTPNKNNPEAKGTQKIKIFVEAEDYDDGPVDMMPQESKTLVHVKPNTERQNIFEVLPLSIETAGINIDEYQRTNTQNYKARMSTDDRDEGTYPSKRQANSQTTQKPKQTTKATTKNTPRPEEKTTARKETTKASTVRTVNQEKVQEEMHLTRPETVHRNDVPRPNSYGLGSTLVLTVNEELPLSTGQAGPTYVDQTRPHQQLNTPRPLAHEEYVKPPQRNTPEVTYVPQAEEEYVSPVQPQPEFNRPSNNRKTQPYEETYDENKPAYQREPERQPAYVPEPEERPAYEREPQRGNRPAYNEYSENQRPSDYGYTSNRPVRENGYAGFPESHQPSNNSPFSRPLQNEPIRAFPASPCLQVFKYEGREPEEDRWYGDIYVFTDEVLIGMRLDITLDRPAEVLVNWVAEVQTKDSVHFTILSLKKRLNPGPAENVRIMVKFDRNKPVPYLQSINLNGRRICPARTYQVGTQTQRTTTRRPLYENQDIQTKRTTEYYQEGPKRSTPTYIDEYEQNTRRTTPIFQQQETRTTQQDRRTTERYDVQDNRRTTARPTTEYYNRPDPNPNGYEETEYNNFNRPTTKKPTQSRPISSNSKPPSPNTQSSNNNKNPTTSTGSTNNRPINSDNTRTIPCGKPSVQPRPLITNGQMTARGQWPWHAALYKNVGADLSYICGGSLISNKHVVTAAHCVTKTYDTRPLDANILVVYLGKYHLRLWSEGGVQNKQVSEVHVHPDYNSTDFKSDLAVLVLSSPVEFTDYIRPVCLWDKRSTRIEALEGKEGTVVGWGFDETKRLTEDLMQAKMPVIKHDVCLWSYPQFFPQFTSNLTYCAGFKNGTSVCNGDSGGGMFFSETKDGDERWYIRGLVSISVKEKDTILCDVKHYIVFTDLAKYGTSVCNGDSGGGMVFPLSYNGEERWYLRGLVSISVAQKDSRVCDTRHYVVFTDLAKFLSWLDNYA